MASAEFNEDWEEWDPSQGNFLHHMVAGSIAGITEHTVMYPVDTFKTYVQCMRECPEAVAGRRVMEMVRGQGLLRLWRGVGTMFTGCVPAHALYFSVLEHCKVGGPTAEKLKLGVRCNSFLGRVFPTAACSVANVRGLAEHDETCYQA